MDEQRVQAYLSLIQELLTCPSGEEPDILNRHQELVDEGFVQVCELVAAQLQQAGQDNQAAFLRNVAQQVGAFLAQRGTGGNQQAALQQFWRQLLQAEMAGRHNSSPSGDAAKYGVDCSRLGGCYCSVNAGTSRPIPRPS